MIADTDAVYEYLPNSPCVAERVILFNQDAEAALKRILSRLGVTPEKIGFQPGDQERCPGEILIVGRDSVTGKPTPWARLMWGFDGSALRAARDELISQAWLPWTNVNNTASDHMSCFQE